VGVKIGEPGLPEVILGVLWLGQDGVEGGDDETVLLTVTDADGRYLVDGLGSDGLEDFRTADFACAGTGAIGGGAVRRSRAGPRGEPSRGRRTWPGR